MTVPPFCREIVRQNLAYAGHVVRGSGGRYALVKEKLTAKKKKVEQRECCLPTSCNGQ